MQQMIERHVTLDNDYSPNYNFILIRLVISKSK